MGRGIYSALDWFLGRGYFFAPLSLIFITFSLFFSGRKKIIVASLLGGILFLLTSLAILEIVFAGNTGGILGYYLGSTAVRLFDFWDRVDCAKSNFAFDRDLN